MTIINNYKCNSAKINHPNNILDPDVFFRIRYVRKRGEVRTEMIYELRYE